jgi:hypothetical protein
VDRESGDLVVEVLPANWCPRSGLALGCEFQDR